jgi:SAM-dependent methyltransferase
MSGCDTENVFRLNQNIAPRGADMISEAARVQQRLWGTDPEAWATHAEAHNRPLFEAVLDAAHVARDTHVLDVGCGSGLALQIAAERGATTSGIDISHGLLEVAQDRIASADLVLGDMEALPFDGASFDAVLGINSFQFAGDPGRALREAARVLVPSGRLVASLFAAPERSQGTVVHEAMSRLVPPAQHDDHAPYALSAAGGLEAALADAGLRVVDGGEVICAWRYASMDDALTGILCSAGGARAREAAGEAAARATVHAALAQFEDSATGVVELRNTFRWVAACR